ncbi:MAG: 6-bladed beta-propeller [Gemmatimonadota bacterium]
MIARTAGIAVLLVALGHSTGPAGSSGLAAQEPPVWEVSSEPTLEIGVVEGAAEYQLFGAVSAVRLDDGRIAVLNAGSDELRIYDADGEHIRSVGGEGGGPGEFAIPVRLYRLGADSLLVYDRGNDRFSVHALDGSFVRTELAPVPRDRFMYDEWLHDRTWVDGPALGQGRAPVERAVTDLPEPDPAAGFRYVKVSTAGHLWVRAGAVPDHGPVSWSVYDLNARPIGRVTTPARFEIHEIGPDYLLGTGWDTLDVEYIQLYRLDMPDAVPTRRMAHIDEVPGAEASRSGAADDTDRTTSSAQEDVIVNMQGAIRTFATIQEMHYSNGNFEYASDTDELDDWTDPEELAIHIVRATDDGWTALFIHRETGATCGMSLGARVPVGWPGGMAVCQR